MRCSRASSAPVCAAVGATASASSQHAIVSCRTSSLRVVWFTIAAGCPPGSIEDSRVRAARASAKTLVSHVARYTYPHTIENGAGERLVFLRRVPGTIGDRLEVENVVTPGAG